MNETLPIPCERCHASGLFAGLECEECRGKGYHLSIDAPWRAIHLSTISPWAPRCGLVAPDGINGSL